jgi:gluconolactonase
MRAVILAALVAALPAAAQPVAHPPPDARVDLPAAIVDLATTAGLGLVRGEWRFGDAHIVEVDSRGPGPDLKPSGGPVRTYEIAPRAGAADFDDSGFERIDPTTLDARRGHGRVSFAWYRLRLTLPDRIGDAHVAGSTVTFEVVVDDYAEVWVDGKLPIVLGQRGGGAVAGFNAPNRVVLTRDARPGQSFVVAVFAMNGPISANVGNFVWLRTATLELHRPAAPARGHGTIERLDAALDAIVPRDARIDKVADGFQFIEGPVWHPDGYLLFSDPNANVIYRWTPDGDLSVFMAKSGYRGANVGAYHQPGSNGLTLDRDGRLTIDQHGERRVVRQEKNGVIAVLADRYQGKRLNSPNDLVYRSDGALYFTDPPFGLPKVYDDPGKELPYSGVFLLKDGKLQLVSTDLAGPNGLAFTPDEKGLYVDNWGDRKKVILRYDVAADGTLAHGRVFFDMTAAPGDEALDGLKVDRAGNVYVSGPGGLWIISPQGKHLGTLHVDELPANFAWGDADGKALYMTARTGLYRVRLNIPGIRP